MTPKEKAEELVDKFENYSFMDIDARISSFESAKQCALIAVDEIIESCIRKFEWYWIEVKQEIEKL
jgi:hypothetical protein